MLRRAFGPWDEAKDGRLSFVSKKLPAGFQPKQSVVFLIVPRETESCARFSRAGGAVRGHAHQRTGEVAARLEGSSVKAEPFVSKQHDEVDAAPDLDPSERKIG